MKRPLPLSPTLSRLAAARAGFTLIEMMIAVAISMIIVVVAVSAFRVASRAISLANALSTENGLLRIGFQDALEDADFYHSEADDKPPYNKKFTRLRTKKTDDPATTDTDQYTRRHFQPVRFLANTDAGTLPFDNNTDPTLPAFTEAWNTVVNPNVIQAHDPRSIDRGFILSNTTPNGLYRYIDPVWVQGDYRLVASTDMRFTPAAASPVTVQTPRLIDPYFPMGAAATFPKDMDGDRTTSELTGTVACPVDTTINQTLPLMAFQIFDRLSFVGMSEYLPNGMGMFIQDQNGDETNASWGGTNKIFTSPKGFPENGSGNQESLSGIWWRSYRTGSRDIANFLGCDWREGMCWSIVTLPVLGAPVGSDYGYDKSSCILQMIMEGNTAGNGTARYWMGWSAGEDVGDTARNDRLYTSTIIRLPYNFADADRIKPTAWTTDNGRKTAHYLYQAPDRDSKPTKYPVLSTSQLRFRRLGGLGSVTVATCAIEDEATGRRTELVCVPYTTTLRGARQHWRLYSPAYDQDGAIGDFYDDAAGPFYKGP